LSLDAAAGPFFVPIALSLAVGLSTSVVRWGVIIVVVLIPAALPRLIVSVVVMLGPSIASASGLIRSLIVILATTIVPPIGVVILVRVDVLLGVD